MNTKRNIIIAAAIAILGISSNAAFADSNNLLQMDIKRSSVSDTVDVTFYTTADTPNSVVTRKSSNKYVVLLPNTSSSSSVAPNFGGVKDLITDIDVKHVNDGMGGYTKVTFGTTKPISIKTHMAKTAPLSQAQKDTRDLIARNNAASKPVVQAQPISKPSTTPVTKPTATKTSTPEKVSALPKIVGIDAPKAKPASTPAKADKNTQQPKVVQSSAAPVVKTPAVVTPQAAQDNGYVPKMKYDSNGRRIIDLEPRVSHVVTTEQSQSVPEFLEDNIVTNNVESTPVAQITPALMEEELPVQQSSGSDFPYWILYVGGAIAVLCIIYLAYDAAKHSSARSKSRLDSFYDVSAKNQVKRRKKEYYDIINNEEYTWQEKYKMYTKKDNKNKPAKHIAAMSYVTDAGLKEKSKPVIKEVEVKEPIKVSEEKTHEEIVNAKVKAKMLELEKSYNAPSADKEISTSKVRSEDEVILKSFNEIKLKSFSKQMSLNESQRSLIKDQKPASRNKSYKEGRFVKIKNSGQIQLEKNDLDTSDLINTGNKYLQEKGTEKMSKERENYLLSSVDEYLSILDTETPDVQAMPAPKVKAPTAEAMSRSGVSNPISAAKARISRSDNMPIKNVSGLVVKSGYNIDPDRGFYVVNIDGVSAIVGRVKENIFVLKKFDRVVDSPIQVRRDDANIYIVRLGKFKCLVDVEQDKMGTLIEI